MNIFNLSVFVLISSFHTNAVMLLQAGEGFVVLIAVSQRLACSCKVADMELALTVSECRTILRGTSEVVYAAILYASKLSK